MGAAQEDAENGSILEGRFVEECDNDAVERVFMKMETFDSSRDGYGFGLT